MYSPSKKQKTYLFDRSYSSAYYDGWKPTRKPALYYDPYYDGSLDFWTCTVFNFVVSCRADWIWFLIVLYYAISDGGSTQIIDWVIDLSV